MSCQHTRPPADPGAMLAQYEPWLYQMAYWCKGRYPTMDVEDLVQEGRLSLLECQTRYDPSRGAHFMTFANLYVRQRMGRFARATRDTVRVPDEWHLAGRWIKTVSLETPAGADNESTIAAFIPVEEPEPMLCHDSGLVSLMHSALKALSPRERDVVESYYLHGEGDVAIGARYGFSHQRSNQIRHRALQRLRQNPKLANAA